MASSLPATNPDQTVADEERKPPQTAPWSLGAPDVSEDEESEEEEFSDEETRDSASSTATSSRRNSSLASYGGGCTSGVSSMREMSEHMRAVNSAATLDDDFFRAESVGPRAEEDEGHVSDTDHSAHKPIDIEVDFVINLDTATSTSDGQPTPVASDDAAVASTSEKPTASGAPLKHHLQPVCTIGTGTFGRVELTKHRETGQYFALKSMYIPSIVEASQVSHVFNEKRILSRLNHPFIVRVFDTAKDNRCLYVIMEFLAGGELFSYLRLTRSLPSPVVKFYSAEIVLALEYLHGLNIAYRDLKPENLMLTSDGHVKLTDFGFAKEIHTKSFTLCGTSEYLAPELANRKGHNHLVDCWALGVLIFELIAGFSPFRGASVQEVQTRIRESNGQPDFPRKTFSANAKSLIGGLLKTDPKERFDTAAVKKHAWYAAVDFGKILARKVNAPIHPTVYGEGDVGNFDTYQELEKQAPAKQRDLDLFDEW